MKNKKPWLLLLFCCLFFITGCGKTNEDEKTSMSDTIDTSGKGMLMCTREATAESEGMEVNLSYEVTYEKNNITITLLNFI